MAQVSYSTRGRPPKPLKTTTHGEAIRHEQNQIDPYAVKVDTKVAQAHRRDILKELRASARE